MKPISLADTVKAVGTRIQLTAADLEKVKAARNSIDTAKVEEEMSKRVKAKNWKKGDRSPNGVLLEDHYQELKDGGLAYTIFIDGKPTIFQTTDIRDGSLLTKATIEEAKAAHLDMLVESLVNDAIPDLVLEKLIEEA